MYENHYDFETLYQTDREELEKRLEVRRKLKLAAQRTEKPGLRDSLILVLQVFRNIFKQ